MKARHSPLPISLCEPQQDAEVQLASPNSTCEAGYELLRRCHQQCSGAYQVSCAGNQAVPANDTSMPQRQGKHQHQQRGVMSNEEPLAIAAAIDAPQASPAPVTNLLMPAEPPTMRPALAPRPGASRHAPDAQLEPAAAGQGATPAAALPWAGLWPLPEPAEPQPLNLTRHIVISPADPFHDDWAFW